MENPPFAFATRRVLDALFRALVFMFNFNNYNQRITNTFLYKHSEKSTPRIRKFKPTALAMPNKTYWL